MNDSEWIGALLTSLGAVDVVYDESYPGWHGEFPGHHGGVSVKWPCASPMTADEIVALVGPWAQAIARMVDRA